MPDASATSWPPAWNQNVAGTIASEAISEGARHAPPGSAERLSELEGGESDDRGAEDEEQLLDEDQAQHEQGAGDEPDQDREDQIASGPRCDPLVGRVELRLAREHLPFEVGAGRLHLRAQLGTRRSLPLLPDAGVRGAPGLLPSLI
ncbi:hypothetical protein ACRAWC_02265 [Leifsonia sp. L25]|uniref:hypothetical protein n=1 Tax=Leifsonia sp. L25 TaxID=3423957 RepID=UPI003D69752E